MKKAGHSGSLAVLSVPMLAMALLGTRAAATTSRTAFCASPGVLGRALERSTANTRARALFHSSGVTMKAPASLEGVYDFTYAGGTFDVHLRPGGRFFAPKFQARATWDLIDDKRLMIDWAKYGKYELGLAQASPPAFEGSVVGDPKNWRKMDLKRPFSEAESKLFDSVWEFQHPGGSFVVEFRADAFNHFVSKDFPAHSHWSQVTDNKILINWGSYGEYEMVLDSSGDTMAGNLKGQPDNWRKAKRMGSLEDQVVNKEVFGEFH